jgi:hypothetical protein
LRDRTRETRPEAAGLSSPANHNLPSGGEVRSCLPPRPLAIPAYPLPGTGPDVSANAIPLRRRGGRPLPTAAQFAAVLAALAAVSRTSLYYLRLTTEFSEDLLAECVNLLAHDGVLTAEERDDGNEPRRMVAITAAGRRALEDGDRSA